MRVALAALFFVLASCATTQGPRVPPAEPLIQDEGIRTISLVPSPTWPVRWTDSAPTAQLKPGLHSDWIFPASPAPVALASAQTYAPLPLPEVRLLPVRQTPASRSWSSVTQAKPAVGLPAPTPVTAAKAAVKPEVKPPATVAAKPASAPAAKATPEPTAAAAANLLPTATTTASDFRWEDVNAVVGDSVTLHFDKTNWLYLDSPAQQKTLGFQTINRDKDATTFVFKPTTAGQYVLEFQRQDLVNQATDARKVKMTVVLPGTRTTTTGTALSPQTSTVPANDALEASRQLAAAGKTAEAVQKLLQSYKADDARINLELGRLLNQSGQDDEALSYLDKNLSLTGTDAKSSLELGTKLAAARDPQKKLPAYVKIWSAGTTAPSEDLYLQVFETLKLQKMGPMLKDWASRYASWYPAPKQRDRYLFLLGQWLEEPGDARDVRGSWKAYNEVVESYPLSPYWKLAGERAAYINRHFLQVR